MDEKKTAPIAASQSLVDTLSTKDSAWTARIDALSSIRGLCGSKPESNAAAEELVASLAPLIAPLSVQLGELRSSVIKDAYEPLGAKACAHWLHLYSAGA